MHKFRERIILLLADVVALNLALFMAYWLRFRSHLAPAEIDLSPTSYLVPALWITLYWLVIFGFSGLYKTSWDISRIDESIALFKAITFGVLVLAVVTLDISQPFPHSRLVVFGYWLALMVLLNVFRLSVRGMERHFRARGYGRRRAIIVGAAERGELLLRELMEYPALGYDIVGFVDDDPEKADRPILGKMVLGLSADLPRLIRDQSIEEVLIAISSTSHQAILRIMSLCVGTRVAFKIVPDLYDIVSGHKTGQVYGFPLIKLFPEPMDAGQRFLKRLFDMVISFVILVGFLPLWILVAVSIKLTSRGPVLFRQRRIGRGGKRFVLYKFRSMIEDAEKDTGPVWAQKNDRRVTKVGRVLRRMRLDEIPQLINVLKGEMSLVGPRPERPYFVEKLAQEIPLYSRRLNVKPGLTGWAQIKHNYDASLDDVREKVRYDLYYIENMSLSLDLKILTRTILVTLTGSGAR